MGRPMNCRLVPFVPDFAGLWGKLREIRGNMCQRDLAITLKLGFERMARVTMAERYGEM
ncbi:hypothetical protein DOTSEDRAFT_69873 [Dothistroma septosporum NZE10]|uniref:Uncharacterized protein n=1 Tax=Dothistroma septosporum (strain NZE10 / CBS 128990) TaxID=675120 RepID=N1Q0B8_DOTSN|nr:hypothetical protein DOTSEDRAFT_69873 [Dothistroma septosporum NZE10]